MGRQNIHDFWRSCKALWADFVADWGLIAVIFLVALASFGMGRLSTLGRAEAPISIIHAPLREEHKGVHPGGEVVASVSGQVYYFPWCTGGANIPPEYQRWFKTEEAAQKAGYRAAKNCKGLEK